MREGKKEQAERVMGMMARWECGGMKEELQGDRDIGGRYIIRGHNMCLHPYIQSTPIIIIQ